MVTIVVDAAIRDKLLAAADSQVELRDESGRVIGKYCPTKVEYPDLDVSTEELDRRMRESPRYTAEQVMERLRRLRDAG